MSLDKRFVLLSAGSNSAGQLGIGHLEDSHIWQTCQTFDSSSSKGDGTISFPPIGWKIDQLSSGAGHTVALLSKESLNDKVTNVERQIWVCGQGTDGQLGPNCIPDDKQNSNFTQLNISSLIEQVSKHSEQGIQPYKWIPKLIKCGWDWTLIVLEDDTKQKDDIILLLGKNNDFLQLGLNVEQSRDSKTGINVIDLRKLCIEAGSRITIDSIACGLRHSLLVCSSSFVKENQKYEAQNWLIGWGACRLGQLGLIEESENKPGIKKKPFVACLPRVIDCWKSDEQAGQRSKVLLEAGKEHSVVYIPENWKKVGNTTLDSQNGLLILGSNRSGQSALNGWESSGQLPGNELQLGSTWNGTFIAKQSRNPANVEILGSGNSEKGQLGVKKDTKPYFTTDQNDKVHKITFEDIQSDNSIPIQLACGSEHVAILIPKGKIQTQVLGWGWNEHGNLAQNDELDRHLPVQIWPPLSKDLIKDNLYIDSISTNVWAGCGTTFVQVLMQNTQQ